MAADLIKTILVAEAKGREMEAEARKKAAKLISDAEIQADIILRSSVEQARSQANLILSEAEYSAVGAVKQAEKLAELREKRSISDTEKHYEAAIQMIFEELLSV